MMKYSPEEILHVECVNFLRVMCPGVLFWHTPNENKLLSMLTSPRRFFLQKKMYALGVLPGVSDLIIFWPDRNGVFVELKAGKNKLTDAQCEFRTRISLMGFSFGTCRTLDEFVNFLKSIQVPMRKGIYGNLVC